MNKDLTDSKLFADSITNAKGELYDALYRHFCDEMFRAVRSGRICTPQRMAQLYPIFREINIEIEEVKREERSFKLEIVR